MQRQGRAAKFASRLSWVGLALVSLVVLAFTGFTTWQNWRGGAWRPGVVSHSMPEEDFANLWAAGRMARGGDLAALYTANGFAAWKQAAFGAKPQSVALQSEAWVYPPTVLLLGVPLSFLPLGWGFLLWDAATLAAAVGLLRWARLPWGIIALGLGGPAAWRSLVLGQYGLVTGALVAAGLVLAPRFPLPAGLMLGLATLKPQQGVIVPVAWVAARFWRAILAAALCFFLLAAAVAVAFGGAAWALFFSRTGALARQLLQAPPPQNYISDGVSVFWMLRTAGASLQIAYIGHLLVAATAAALVYRAWRLADAAPLPRVAATLCLSLFITPYGFTSDMVGVAIALGVLLAAKGWRVNLVDGAIWLWPAYCPLVTLKTGVLWTPWVVAVVAVRAWRLMHDPKVKFPQSGGARPPPR